MKECTWVDLLLKSGLRVRIPVESQAAADQLEGDLVARVLAEDDAPLLVATHGGEVEVLPSEVKRVGRLVLSERRSGLLSSFSLNDANPVSEELSRPREIRRPDRRGHSSRR